MANVSVTATTATLTVGVSSVLSYSAAITDDGVWDHNSVQDDGVYTSAAYLLIGNIYGDWYNNFIIFRNVLIPNGATIGSAEINLVASGSTSGTTVNAIIYANDIDDVSSAPATATIGNALDLTSASVTWDDIAAWTSAATYTTPDIKTIIQEIVNRAGWESGNDLMIIIKDNASTPGSDAYRTGRTYNTGSYPELEISFNVDNSADIEIDVVHVNATTATLTAAPQAATVCYEINVTVTTDTFTITPYDAAIWDGAAWEAWIAANSDKLTRKYFFTLTGDADGTTDAAMPISSFQCRRYAGRPTYLSVVIPDTSYASQINARSNGDMKLEMSYEVNSVEVYRETITLVDLEDIQIDEGASNASISLTGHRTVSFTSKAITLRDIQYYRLKDGLYTVRCLSPDLYLNPGDTVNAHGNIFTVDTVAYIVSERIQTMEVKEA